MKHIIFNARLYCLLSTTCAIQQSEILEIIIDYFYHYLYIFVSFSKQASVVYKGS